jgi:hypothetical protein
MFSKRLLLGHGTVVAYISLFIALGGSGYAATRIAAAASSAPVKVRCSATHAGKKVSCKVVKGSGVGPRGPQGPPGKNGNSAASGPTTYSQPPGFSFVEQTPGVPASSAVSVNIGSLHDGDEWQNIALFTAAKQDIPTSAPGEPVLQTLVNGPTEFLGSSSHFYSAGFCYGGQLSPAESSEQLTHIALVEYIENNGPVPADSAAPPGYTTATLWSAPITGAVPASANGAGGCMTVTPPKPVAIQPNGYLALWFTPTYTAPSGDQDGAQISFGRITTSFGP